MATNPNAPTVSTGGGHAMPSTARQPQVYQIDFTAVASGKRIASTKRRVRWRFGFANPDALAAGETGTACRGEEHDVTIVWSLTSGKRLVLADGTEVHYSNSRAGVFDFSWTMRGNHVLKIIAHAAPPLSPQPGFRQYDFMVDGQSFFTFPKVYRLGMSPNDPRRGAASPKGPMQLADRGRTYNGGRPSSGSVRSNGGSVNVAKVEAPTNPDEEEAYLQEAIRQSLQDEKPPPKRLSASSAPPPASDGGVGDGGGDLLDFGSDGPATAPALPPSTSQTAPALPPSTSSVASGDPFVHGSSVPAALPSSGPFASYAQQAPAPLAATAAPLPALPAPEPAPTTNGYGPSYGAPPPTGESYGAAAPFAMQAPAASSFGGSGAPQSFAAPPPGASGYGPPAPAPFTAPAPISTQQPYGIAPDGPAVPPAVAATPQPQATPSTLGLTSPPADFSSPAPAPAPAQAEPTAAAPVDPALLTMNALSGQQPQGLFDSNSAAAAPAPSGSLADQAYSKLVNMDTFSLVSNKDEERANPFEASAAASTSIMSNQSLADMKAKSGKGGPSKEIMKSAAAPGAMVVSANQTSSYGSQYGVQPMQQQGHVPPLGGGYGVAQPMYGQQPPPMQQQPLYNGQQPPPAFGQNPPAFGQPPPPQQYGQAPFGQQQPPQQYGQPYSY